MEFQDERDVIQSTDGHLTIKGYYGAPYVRFILPASKKNNSKYFDN